MKIKAMLESVRRLKDKRDSCRLYDQIGFSPEIVKEGKHHFELWWDSWILPELEKLESELNSSRPLTSKEKMDRVRLHNTLLHTLTEYDQQQSTKPGHNRYALGHYCKALQLVMKDVSAGASPRKAIISAFMHPLQNRLLKAIGEPAATDEEQDRDIIYTPASKRFQ